MTTTPQPSPILRTKLYRPPVTEDYVSRPDIEHVLNTSLAKPLTIVVAPAGYGKSTLVSAWKAQSAQKSAWLSLDDSDSDIRVFLAYLLAAIRTAEPDFGTELQGLIDAEVLPAPDVMAIYLSNELESLDERVTLVLDDYHNIRDQDIHRMLDALLKHPPATLHLVIASRRDPAISLQSLRAHNEVVEIRMRQLLFSEADTGALLDAAGIGELDATVVKRLHGQTEGWPAGIRLAMLASLHRDNPQDYLNSFGSKSRHLRDYILQDLIEGLPGSVTMGLMSVQPCWTNSVRRCAKHA